MPESHNQTKPDHFNGISLLIPIFNEQHGIPDLWQSLEKTAASIDEAVEIVFVDDGSTDNSLEQLKALKSPHLEQQIIAFSRNFGKEAAMTAGLRHCRGQAIIILDADLQDPPELIPAMLEQWHKGFDVVNMRRKQRHGETWFKKLSAKAFYRFINHLSEDSIPENVGDFRLLSARVVDSINRLPERNRFMKGILAWPGFKQTTLEFDRPQRELGDSKWNISQLVALAVDGITSFSTKPLRLATWLGLSTAMFAIIYATWVVVKTLVYGESVAGYPTLMITLLFSSAIQLIALGVIGEYLARVFIEVKQRPIYQVAEHHHEQPLVSITERQPVSPVPTSSTTSNSDN
ncbi:glycosyltransferase [Alginatibacterium sediminis]|uniref:Glycosyltransferase n=1 Tax=Alginatibacterium sediminis TaxID=2164068 RepID=A0A420EFU8_9ALTE|nr:glycosyltransferase family 2 protein [Alginatibacterium sediminis]RKF19540.1 glycosyltransferase [Alginatibacterium sediminis]